MKRTISIIMIVAMLCSVMVLATSCGEEPLPPVALGNFTETLSAQKVGTLSIDSFSTCPGGLIYKDENGMKGVMSLEGNKDTGAKYKTVVDQNIYFKVSRFEAKSATDITALNSFGLIDGKGNQLIPEAYADFDIINKKYVVAMRVTAQTYIEDNATVTLHNFDHDFITDNIMFEGSWVIYDVTTGKTIPGVTGKKAPSVLNYGEYIKYKDESTGDYIFVNANGDVQSNVTLFDNGSYSIEDRIGTMYDKDGKQLFVYDLTGFIPKYLVGENYISSQYVDGVTKSIVVDKTGAQISTEFIGNISVYGNLIHCENKIYNMKGENIVDGEFSSVYYDKLYGSAYLLYKDEVYTMIKEDGSILYRGKYTDNTSISSTDFTASTKKDDERYYWSYKDKDYTIKGYSFAPFLVKVNSANYKYDIVNTINGETMLQGYDNYSYSRAGGTALYVYAKYNGGTDVYLIVNPKQLAELEAKKTKLLSELLAAFDAAGIKVTINEKTGEMSMDSSVLFGGDSAELTAAGKEFLNKFIGVYTKIAFNGEYDGFISKTMVEGHAAPVEGSTYASGLQLSEDRAKNVLAYCISAETGVDVSKIANSMEAVGYSNSQPVVDAAGNVNLEASRRVSFRFMLNIDVL